MALSRSVPGRSALLMRILSIAQRLHSFKLQGENGGELYLTPLYLFFKVAGDQAVVASGMLKDFHRQFAP